jgi:hypothetical protein
MNVIDPNSKLKNIEAIKQMLQGTHKFQTKTTVTFSDVKPLEEHIVGDVWTDSDGNEWEQKNGYKIKRGKLDELRQELDTFTKCPKDICTCIEPSRADLKMKSIHNMCLDCVIEMEHNLRLDGKYEEYEKDKMKQNVIAWLKDTNREVEELKVAMRKAPEFVFTDGRVDKWKNTYDPDIMEQNIDTQYKNLKQQLCEQYGITELDFV